MPRRKIPKGRKPMMQRRVKTITVEKEKITTEVEVEAEEAEAEATEAETQPQTETKGYNATVAENSDTIVQTTAQYLPINYPN